METVLKRLKQNHLIFIKNHLVFQVQGRFVSYTQGQEPESKVREYFYFIDHQGMLFLDDCRVKNFTSCFKEKKFLQFFFKHLKINNTNRYKTDFPYISLCGPERNFIRCDDYPFVYTHVISMQDKEMFCYGHAGDLLAVPFEPDKIIMSPDSGRVYHPAPNKAGGIGLVRSMLAIEFSKYFNFENGEMNPPTHFNWNNQTYCLQTDWYKKSVIMNRNRNIFVRDDLLEKELL